MTISGEAARETPKCEGPLPPSKSAFFLVGGDRQIWRFGDFGKSHRQLNFVDYRQLTANFGGAHRQIRAPTAKFVGVHRQPLASALASFLL